MESKIYHLIGFFLLSLFLLSGCGNGKSKGDNSPSEGEILLLDFSMPMSLSVATDRAIAVLSPGDESTSLNITGDTVGGTISNIAPGTYTLTITYSDSFTATTLATITKENITVVAGKTTSLTILDSELNTDIDDDFDGFSNLAEVLINTDPDSNLSVPDGGSPAFLAGSSVFSSSSTSDYSFKIIAGEAVAGSYSTLTNNSTDYEINAGFKGF